MKNLVVAIVASLLMLSASCGNAHPEVVPQKEYDFACRYTAVFYGTDCNDLPPPKVSWVPLGTTAGRYYPGTDVIFVNMDGVSYATNSSIFVHETVHYILSHKANVTPCQSEEAARRATANFLKRQYDDVWRITYGC